MPVCQKEENAEGVGCVLLKSDYPGRFVIELQSVKVETNVWHQHLARLPANFPFVEVRKVLLKLFISNVLTLPKKYLYSTHPTQELIVLVPLSCWTSLAKVLNRSWELRRIMITNGRIFIELKRCFASVFILCEAFHRKYSVVYFVSRFKPRFSKSQLFLNFLVAFRASLNSKL